MEFVELKDVVLPDWGWHYEDREETAKLTASLTKFGQLMPLLVRELDNGYEVIDGRRRLEILRQLETPGVWIKNVGRVTRDMALKLALTLELAPRIDYPAMAVQVSSLDDDHEYQSLPTFTPYTWERIGYFKQLTTFDWSQFSGREQVNLFDDDPEPVAKPAAPPAAPVAVETPATPQAAPKKAAAPKAKPPLAPQFEEVPVERRRDILRRALFTASRELTDTVPEGALPAVASTATAVAGIQGLVEEISPSGDISKISVESVSIAKEVLITFGEDHSAPRDVDPNWRPDEPPCLDGIDEVQLDCETDGLKWWAGERPIGIAVRLPDGTKKYLPWGHAGGNLDEAVVRRWAERELRGKLITNINSRFDNHTIYAWGVDLEAQGCTWGDVAHDAALLDEYRKEFSLAALSRDYLGENKTGEDLDKARMASCHASQVAEYAKQDVHLVAGLRRAMEPLIEAQELQRVRALERDVIYPVCEMERNAAIVDRARLQEFLVDSQRMLDGMAFEIAREAGFQMNPDKNADWVKLFDHFKLPYPGRTDKGSPSFADALLEKVTHPVVQMARRVGKIASLRSKFIVPYSKVVAEDHKLRFALHQLRGDEYGTVRGRFSMSGGDRVLGQFGANLQQVLRVNSQRELFGYAHNDDSHDAEIFMIRSLFVPGQNDPLPRWADPALAAFERQYLSADAQAIEYRLAAHFAYSHFPEYKKIIEAYQADFDKLARGELTGKWVDFHAVVGGFVRPYKDLSRNIIKNLNFCKIYGGGRDTVARTLGLERPESDQIVDIYDKTFPEFGKLLKKAEELAKRRGYVKTIAGRRARFPTGEFTYAALNYVIQGSAADIMKTKLVELHKARKVTGFVMRQTVHDEVDGDTLTPDTARLVREILNHQSFKLHVPIVWEVETGPNWAVAH